MSELRQDLVSGDWIIMAPDRVKRPHELLRKTRRVPAPKRTCPFENLQKSGNDIRVQHPSKGPWKIAVIRNKYPALARDERCAMMMREGPYSYVEGIGHHDLVVTRSHTKNFADVSLAEAVEVFQMFQRMHRRFKQDGCSQYVSTFANWGPSAGASLYHPHYQLLALPIVPPNVQHSLDGSRTYFHQHHRCVHCDMLLFEVDAGTRVIEENARAVAVAPYVSRQPFEVRIYPSRHIPYFANARKEDFEGAARVLQSVLRRMRHYLSDPDFNFFIHTAPLEEVREHEHYHWHIEIFPKVSTLAGFELSTGVDINVIAPEETAAFLRGERKIFKKNV